MNRKFASPLLTQPLILNHRNGDPYEELDPFIIGFYTYIFRMFAIAGIFVIVGMSVLGIITIILSCFSAC